MFTFDVYLVHSRGQAITGVDLFIVWFNFIKYRIYCLAFNITLIFLSVFGLNVVFLN